MAGGGKHTLTPKAIIHQKFGANAIYTVEEVHDSSHSACPGLAIPQKGPSLFRCHLQLPEFSVVSNVCKKKKDSEQSAAELALDKVWFDLLIYIIFLTLMLTKIVLLMLQLGIRPQNDDLTVDEAWDDLVGRIKYIFSDEVSKDHMKL